MKYIEVEYNRELQPLEAVLSDVKHPGNFFVAGVMELPMPRVEVEGVGTLSFPIPRAQIEAMVRRATQAPYGRGEETIVDTSVRNVWQIPPDAVRISGKSWASSFQAVLSKVTAGLGCHDAAVSAELYKLLIYDRGGFFLAHRDTEKTEGMFGTLVLTLPSAYRGGALRIRHASREVTVETNATDPSELSFAAFYADCEHEALPVHEGNRVCLVYNLIQERTKSRPRVPTAPNYGSHVAQAAALLKAYWSAPDAPLKIAWLLDHQYSPAGLSFSSLKGADAAKAQLLIQAAGQARCVAHLGVVHIGETGGAEADEDYYSSSRRNRFRDYSHHDEEEKNGDEDASFTAITLDDGWRYLDEWRDTEDRAVEFGRLPLTERELLPAGALDEEPPDHKRLTEASGNEGATYERSYRRAALVIWPKQYTMDVLLGGGVVAALPYLKRLAAGGKSARPEAIVAAQRLVEAWSTGAERVDRYAIGIQAPGASDRASMIAALVELNAPAELERFIREVVTSAYEGSENVALLASVSVLGDPRAAAVVSALVEARMANRPGACAELLLALTADRPASFRQVAEAAVAGLDRIGLPESRPDVFVGWEPKERRPLAPEFIEHLLSGLRRLEDGELIGVAARKIASRPGVFNPTTLVVPAIERIQAQGDRMPPAVDQAVQHLWSSAAEFLLLRSEIPPLPPQDWRLHQELSCTCADCTELQAFVRSPAERVHRFRVKKERRGHLHRMIDQNRLDMTHVTERVGSPQTLVCTKDRRTFQARMKEYQSEIAAMGRLMKLAHRSTEAAALAGRMEAAIQASAI